jgi:DNA-binding transcriptional ArsR family regulator
MSETVAASVPETPVMPSDFAATARQMHRLGDPTRLAILAYLADGPAVVGTIRTSIDMRDWPRLSYHLSVLKQGGLVASTRRKTFRIYELTETGERVWQIAKTLRAMFAAAEVTA